MWMIAIVFDVFVAIFGGGDLGSSWAEDLKNRNDRGLLKKPSDKYVC